MNILDMLRGCLLRAGTGLTLNAMNVTGVECDIDNLGSFVESFRAQTNATYATNTTNSMNATTEANATSRAIYGHVCGKLATLMNSTEDFVLLATQNTANSAIPSGLLMGEDTTKERCQREKTRTGSEACSDTAAQVAEKERENPGSFILRSILPMCMG